jgi:L-alanine-DL-glutamate epimerase-like enolase superfamily enzyme
MLDESLRKPSDVELFAQMEVADAINFHPSKLGCLAITREAILKAQRLGMKANIGSALMTEIGLFHYLNLAASIPRLDYPLEEPGLCNVYTYSIVQESPMITNGYIKLFNINVIDLDFNIMKKFLMRSLFKERLLGEVSKIYARFKKVYSQL